jgi:hypothetical protein
MASSVLIILGGLAGTHLVAFYVGWLIRDRKHRHYYY